MNSKHASEQGAGGPAWRAIKRDSPFIRQSNNLNLRARVASALLTLLAARAIEIFGQTVQRSEQIA